MDQFNLLGKSIAGAFGGSFYHFGTYSALTCGGCFIRVYEISSRCAVIASVNLRVIELDYNKCLGIMWKIILRAERYYYAIRELLPQPIAEELSECIILPVNILYEEFTRE